MKNVRHRIILSMVIFSLLATVTAGGFSLAYILGIFKQNTNDYLIATSKAYGNELNTAIVSVESTVETLSRSILGIVEKDQLDDPDYFRELSVKIEKIVAQFDRNTVSAMSVYVRFDPKISYATAGVFHADTNGDGLLETLNPTDLSLYSPSDREHVGWFYEPMLSGKAIWMNPYHNANIDIDMVSYIAPLFVEGKAVGVVGIDINFDQLRKIVEASTKVGKVILFDQQYYFLVHDTYLPTESLTTIEQGKLSGLQRTMEEQSSGTAVYVLLGVNKILGFDKLKNGWTVVVALTEAEAFSKLNNTIWVLVILNLLVTLAMMIVAIFIGRYINGMILRNNELEKMVAERTIQLSETNVYLEESMAELENQQAELTLVNEELEASIETLKETQSQLIVSEKLASLGKLVAGVAHEINTPLGTGITLVSYLDKIALEIKEQYNTGRFKATDFENYLEHVLETTKMSIKSLQKVAELIDTFKQVAVDQSTLDIRKINLFDYINMVVNNLVPKQNEYDLKIVLNGDQDIVAVTYPGAILQIVTHLINNSLVHGFADKTSGTIQIGIEKKGSIIKITYEDDGNGVASENSDKIFTPFFSTRKSKGAAGLGLHIVHNLVTQNLMGTLAFHSEYGNGVAFEIVFKELSI